MPTQQILEMVDRLSSDAGIFFSEIFNSLAWLFKEHLAMNIDWVLTIRPLEYHYLTSLKTRPAKQLGIT